MKNFVLKPFILLILITASLSLSAADFQQGLRLKAENKLEAAASEFESVIQQNPRDTRALEQLAVTQGWLGRYEASIANWQRLLALEPQREDARIGIARVQYWSKQWPAAIQTLDDVLTRQPRSAEALTLKGDVLMARQMPEVARAAYLTALQSGGDPADLQKKLTRAIPPKRWRLDAGTGVDNFSNQRGTEYNGFTQLGYSLSPSLNIYSRIEAARQFDRNDTTVFAGGYWLAVPGLLLFGEAGYTPTADFRPESQGLLGLEILANQYIQPLLSYRFSRYDGTGVNLQPGAVAGKGTVNTVTPGLRLVLPGTGNLEARYAISENLDGSRTKVSQLRVNVDAGERWAPYLAYFKGDEALPPQALAAFKVLALGTTYQLDDAWNFRADFSYEDRPGFYTRKSLSLGLSYRF